MLHAVRFCDYYRFFIEPVPLSRSDEIMILWGNFLVLEIPGSFSFFQKL